MATVPETVRTDVDSLVELIKKKKEVAFEDAAKELGVPISTIEAWATFLEEEKIVQVKYHFTTPYFSYIASEKTKDVDDILGEVQNLIKQTQDHVRDMNIDAAREKHDLIKSWLQSLPASFVDHNQGVIHELEDLHDMMNVTINNFYVEGKDYDKNLDDYTSKNLEFAKRVADLSRVAGKAPDAESAIDPDEHIGHVENLLKEVFASVQQNDFTEAKKGYPALIDHMDDLKKEVVRRYGKDALSEGLAKQMEEADTLLHQSLENVQQNRMRDAKEAFVRLHGLLTGIFIQLKSVMERGPPLAMPDVDNTEALLKMAYQEIQNGNFENAKKLYARLEEHYTSLPGEFMEKKTSLKHTLVKLNRDLALNIGEYSAKDIVEKANEIYRLIKLAYAQLRGSDLVGTTTTYKNIEAVYYSLPDGFLRQKTAMQRKILDLQEHIIERKKDLYFKDFLAKGEQLSRMLAEFKGQLARKDVDQATAWYDKVRELFGQLPPGFLEERTAIQMKVLDLHRELLMLQTKGMRDKMDRIESEIKALLKQVEEKVSKNSIEEANKLYDKIEELYRQIPEGFLKRKSDIQNDIIKVCERLAEKLDIVSETAFTEKKAKIDKELKNIRKYIENNEHDLAGTVYEEVVQVYNQLPAGFLEKRTVLRSQILTMYKDIMQSHDHLLLERLDANTKEKYNELLKILVKVHEHIDAREFEAIMIDYEKIAKIYHNLPIGFVQENLKIRDEILLVFRKLRLYELTKRLDTLAKEGRWADLKRYLDYIFTSYTKLSQNTSEDVELFKFVNERYHANLSLFEGQKKPQEAKQPEKALEVHELKDKMLTTESRLNRIDHAVMAHVETSPQMKPKETPALGPAEQKAAEKQAAGKPQSPFDRLEALKAEPAKMKQAPPSASLGVAQQPRLVVSTDGKPAPMVAPMPPPKPMPAAAPKGPPAPAPTQLKPIPIPAPRMARPTPPPSRRMPPAPKQVPVAPARPVPPAARTPIPQAPTQAIQKSPIPAPQLIPPRPAEHDLSDLTMPPPPPAPPKKSLIGKVFG
ncbi:MAG: hypothetical protein V1735_00970 [Nanoarchaeota archaeon]